MAIKIKNDIVIDDNKNITANNYNGYIPVNQTITISPGNGLLGGGNLSANRTLSINAGNGLLANSSGVHIATGNGVLANSTALWVGAGDGITVNTNDVAVDSTVVRTSGNQTIGGVKTFSSSLILLDNQNLTLGSNNDTTFAFSGATTRLRLTTGNLIVMDQGATTPTNRFIFYRETGNFLATGDISGATLSGDGANITNINATNISTGTIADARIPTTITRTSRTISTSNGILGGGDLTANRTLSINAGQALVTNSTGLHVVAGAGLSSNTSGLWVGAGDGITVGSSTVGVNSTVVRTSGNQTISGNKTFSNDVILTDATTLNFGSNSDVTIGFSGSHTNMRLAVGNLYLIDQSPTTPVTRFTFARTTGNFTASGEITAYSDQRLKTDIKKIDNALDKVKKLRGVEFKKDGKNSIGVIAQEIQKVLPEVVHENDAGYLSVAYGNIVGILIEAIKELEEKLEKK